MSMMTVADVIFFFLYVRRIPNIFQQYKLRTENWFYFNSNYCISCEIIEERDSMDHCRM